VRWDFQRLPPDARIMLGIRETDRQLPELRRVARRLARMRYRHRRALAEDDQLVNILLPADRRRIEFWGEIEHLTGLAALRRAWISFF
jgi:hypothetical protein